MTSLVNRYAEEAGRWNAVQTRDARADGLFVYAVISTKIYCRPVCKARRARRKNVTFFNLSIDAENAGFRACKRCKPNELGTIPPEQGIESVRRFIQLLDSLPCNTAESPNNSGRSQTPCLEEMASQAGLSKWHFHRLFKRQTGTTPMRYLERRQRIASQPSYDWDSAGLPTACSSGQIETNLIVPLESWDGGGQEMLDPFTAHFDLGAIQLPFEEWFIPTLNPQEQEMLSWLEE
ncbi:uncharacterized protein E0L32_008597 [Thyridium curvatum]|uniref:HTH araC/xylS-type domain-containing protein n=1 Tax=Thyridium curvatum TaxID=1093900 RepID=A0A507B065_9PEZI|nr:uncharacterized protein E0L32_008597 [Thyridium curvatum]TPX10378.1 hypothetical protein E0L32_008597 [Thyridium curvatum]